MLKIIKTFALYAFFLWLWLWFVPIRLVGQSPVISTANPLLLYVGGALLVAGLVITFMCMLSFALRGKGTPLIFDPPRSLVTGILYSRVRNPMYLGFILLLLGEAIVFQSVMLLAVCAAYWLVTHLFVVFYEERTLKRRFGESYENYRAAVPRWLPRLRGSQTGS